MKSWTLAIVFAAALLLLAPSMNAQCLNGATPLGTLVGPWAYHAEMISTMAQPPLPFSYVSAGTFTASIGATSRAPGVPAGVIRAVQTSMVNGNPVRLESDYGASTYDGFADCSGVTLHLLFSTRPLSFDCWFQAARTILYCVSIIDEFPVILLASRVNLTVGLAMDRSVDPSPIDMTPVALPSRWQDVRARLA